MQTRNKLFDDAARLAGGAVGTLAGVRREVESLVRQQMERVLASLDLVTRDEFDAVKEMAAKARADQEALANRIEALEAALADRRKTASKGKKAVRTKAAQPPSARRKRPTAKKGG